MDYDGLSMDIHNFFYNPFLLESSQIAAFAGSYGVNVNLHLPMYVVWKSNDI
jgi:hypothetical protein